MDELNRNWNESNEWNFWIWIQFWNFEMNRLNCNCCCVLLTDGRTTRPTGFMLRQASAKERTERQPESKGSRSWRTGWCSARRRIVSCWSRTPASCADPLVWIKRVGSCRAPSAASATIPTALTSRYLTIHPSVIHPSILGPSIHSGLTLYLISSTLIWTQRPSVIHPPSIDNPFRWMGSFIPTSLTHPSSFYNPSSTHSFRCVPFFSHRPPSIHPACYPSSTHKFIRHPSATDPCDPCVRSSNLKVKNFLGWKRSPVAFYH